MASEASKDVKLPEQIHELPNWLTDLINFRELPVFDLGKRGGHTDYIDFITVDEVTAPIMVGVDKFRRPFVILRVINNKTGKKSVHTIFQRYTDSIAPWCCGTCYDRIIDTCVRDTDREYLTRLLTGKPCGPLPLLWEEKEQTTMEDGKSVIELC